MIADRDARRRILFFLLYVPFFFVASCGQTYRMVPPNRPPVADAGADRTVYQGQPFRLSGSGSSDPDGGIVTYQWVQTAGRRAECTDDSTVNPACAAPFIGHPTDDLEFMLTVIDGNGSSASDTVRIHVIKQIFFDDFRADTRREYNWGGGRASEVPDRTLYYWQLRQILVVPGASNIASFSRNLPACDNGTFSFGFSAIRVGTRGGRVRVVLREDPLNFYEVSFASGKGAGFSRKVVRGMEVDRISLSKSYQPNDWETVKIVFNRKSMSVDAFREVATMKNNGESIFVKRFEIFTEGQETFFSNLAFTQDPDVRIIIPFRMGLWDSTLLVRAAVENLPSGARVLFTLDADSHGRHRIDVSREPFEAMFHDVTLSAHAVSASVVDDSGDEVLATANTTYTPTDGYYVAIGDSITKGSAPTGMNTGGYEPVLEHFLESAKGYPHVVFNEGVGGDTSVEGLLFINSLLEKHSKANYFLIMYGTNDSKIPIPSGKGLKPGDPGYPNSYKENMQKIITRILSARKTPILAKVPVVWGIQGEKAHFRNPDRIPRNMRIREYNEVIDELIRENGIPVTPPDFYSYFKNHRNEYFDNVHPDRTGYQSMAEQWFQVLMPGK